MMKQLLSVCVFFGSMAIPAFAQVADSSAQWTWVHGDNTINATGHYGQKGTAAPGNTPPSRIAGATCMDADGNLWMFGGNGKVGYNAGTNGMLNDLWKYDPVNNEWTWVSGSDSINRNGRYGIAGIAQADNMPGGRQGPAMWVDSAGKIWIFGGAGYLAAGTAVSRLNDLWKFDPVTFQWTWMGGATVTGLALNGVFNTPGSNWPGARNAMAQWVDSKGNLWIFGGWGHGDATTGYLNDFWHYNLQSGIWTWIGGSNGVDQQGMYSGNTWPGGRYALVGWTDNNDELWLMGGEGRTNTTAIGKLNDIWKFDKNANVWEFKKGSLSVNDAGSASPVRGVSNVSNLPRSRSDMPYWTDTGGNLWICGGNLNSGRQHDIWKYDVVSNNWIWMKYAGAVTTNQATIYGTKGTQSPASRPGSRASAMNWTDKQGNFWFFGGSEASTTAGRLSDMWILQPVPPVQPDMFSTAPPAICAGSSNVIYTIPAVSGATSYDWHYSGTNVSFTANTTTPSNTISFAANATDGILRVRAVAAVPGPWRDTGITVNSLPTVTSTNTGSQAICAGDSLLLTATGSGGVSYQWKHGTTNVGANSSTYYAKVAGDYTVTVTNSSSCTATSAPVTSLTVNALPSVSVTNTGVQTICEGDSLLLTAGGSSGVTYQWKHGAVNVGTNSSTYYAKISGDYTVTVTNSHNCSATSEPGTSLTVNSLPTVTSTYTGSQSICAGDSLLLTAGGSSGVTYQWRRGSTAVGANSSTFYAGTAGDYTVTATNSNNCSVTSTPATNLTVNVLPVISVTVSGPLELCTGGTVTLTATQLPGTDYRWLQGSSNVGVNSNIYTASETGAYKVVATTAVTGCSDSTQPVEVFVYNRPLVSLVPDDTAFCKGGVIRLEVMSGDTGLTYVWKNSATTIPFARAGFLEITETGDYSVEVGRASVPGCDTTTNEVTVTVHPLPVVDVTWDGETLRATPGGENYQWYNNGQIISGATDAAYVPRVNSGYSVTVADANECTGISPVYNITNVKTSAAEIMSIAAMIRIYPNPVQDILHVSSPVPLNASLYSMDGQILMQKMMYSNEMNLACFPPGIYLLRLSDANTGFVLRNERFIKR